MDYKVVVTSDAEEDLDRLRSIDCQTCTGWSL